MDFSQQVRLAIYQMTVTGGRVPSFEELAAARGLQTDQVRSAYRTLADTHVIVLEPGSMDVWSAPPFSAVPTPFRVHVAPEESTQAVVRSWYAPCAWDAFGIPAVLKQDVTIDASCSESGQPLPAAVRAGQAVGSGIIHLEVPARRFWEDIFYT
jgi:DNA-binding transcriptional MocR family regulator